tara:strand:- start:176 stop:736 length:561 start_codon:yes stop_codon:yes gene_type:complete
MILLTNEKIIIKVINEKSDPRLKDFNTKYLNEVERIYKRESRLYGSGCRSKEKIANSVWIGLEGEAAILIKYPDSKLSDVIYHDIFYMKKRIESKITNWPNTWPIRMNSDGSSTYKFFYDNVKKNLVDSIILNYKDNSGDIYLKYIARIKSFKDYVKYYGRVGKYDFECYDAEEAIRNGDCREVVI